MRDLKEREIQEINNLQIEEQLLKEKNHLYECFVEDLKGYELFDKLIEGADENNEEFMEIKMR